MYSMGKYVFLFGDRYPAPIGVKICMMIHIGPGEVFSFLGRYPRGPKNLKFWPCKKANISKTVSCNVTRQVQLDDGSNKKLSCRREAAHCFASSNTLLSR